ncbi:MAG: hypoxanthine phosphoribosyltransferase [Candidatus Wallbacteria bacterium]|nr:hypoxanthine phosphoribosyltransferase [Candidatus Wallbacteria bacterium]
MIPEGNIEILIDEKTIASRVDEVADQINRHYGTSEVLLVCILKGAFIFAADLIRRITSPCTIDFMIVSSYGDEIETSGEIRIVKDLQKSIFRKKILIVEDIVDTGLTLDHLIKYLDSRGPDEIRICTLLNKKDARRVEVPVDFCAFEVGNDFVIGYGLDYSQYFRNLPYVGKMVSSGDSSDQTA